MNRRKQRKQRIVEIGLHRFGCVADTIRVLIVTMSEEDGPLEKDVRVGPVLTILGGSN